MKKRKQECPYVILVIVTSVLFACFCCVKDSNAFTKRNVPPKIGTVNKFAEEVIADKGSGKKEESVSGNSPAKEPPAVPRDVSGNVSGNGVGDVSGNGMHGEENTVKTGQEYLDDTLFIGDSRTATLQQYAGWDNARFYVKNGLTIWNVLEAKIAECGGELMTVEEALQIEKFGKIYIMLGINELGRGTPDTFAEEFGTVIRRLKELQPDAVIVLEAIMHVTESKDAEETYINNAEINARNSKLKELADEEGVYWLDVNPVTDEEGKGTLGEEYSFDGVHLKVKYLDVWKDFILENPFPVPVSAPE